MPRYVLDIPQTDHEQLVEVAYDEGVPPRTLIVWLLKTDLAARFKQVRRRHVTSASTPEPQVA